MQFEKQVMIELSSIVLISSPSPSQVQFICKSISAFFCLFRCTKMIPPRLPVKFKIFPQFPLNGSEPFFLLSHCSASLTIRLNCSFATSSFSGFCKNRAQRQRDSILKKDRMSESFTIISDNMDDANNLQQKRERNQSKHNFPLVNF